MTAFHPDNCECPICLIENSPECSVCHRAILQGRSLPSEEDIYGCSACGETLCRRCVTFCATCECEVCPRCVRICGTDTCNCSICPSCAEESRHCAVCGGHLALKTLIEWGSKIYCSRCDPYWQLTWQRRRVELIAAQVKRRLTRESLIEVMLPDWSRPTPVRARCPACFQILSRHDKTDVCTTHWEVDYFHNGCLRLCSLCGVPVCTLCLRKEVGDSQYICSVCARFEDSYQTYKNQRESRQN